MERILRAENKKVGRGYRRSLLVKWKIFAEPTWEPRSNLEDTEVLDVFESQYGTEDNVGENIGSFIGRRKVTKRSLLKQSTVRLSAFSSTAVGDNVTGYSLEIWVRKYPAPSVQKRVK